MLCTLTIARSEHRNRLHQLLRLRIQAAGSGCHLLYKRGILLGRLVHLRDGFSHLSHAGSLFTGSRTDLTHDVGDTANAAHHLGHRGARLAHQHGALLHPLHAGANEALDFLGRFGGAPGQ